MRRLSPAPVAGPAKRPRSTLSPAQLLMRRRLARLMPRHPRRVAGIVAAVMLAGTVVAGTTHLADRKSLLDRMMLPVTADLGLSVQSVEVEGRAMTAPADILKAIGAARGVPILGINPAQAKNRLEGLSWVRSAVVERRLPGTIHIVLTERQPLALWQYHGQMMLIDHDGVIVTTEDLGRFANLLLVVGQDAPAHTGDLLALLNQQPALMKHVQSAVWVSQRRWDIHLDNGITVMLPETGPAGAWTHLANLENDHQLMARRIDLIDLRFPDRVVVRLTPDPALAQAAGTKSGSHHGKHSARHA